MRRYKVWQWFAITLVGLLFVGCSARAPIQHHIPLPRIGHLHPFTPYEQRLVNLLRQKHVRVIKQAERLLIVLPVDRFFQFQTTQLRYSYQLTMERVALLLRAYASYFGHPMFSVTGFTDTVYSRKTRQALSLSYAKVIAANLWNNGVSRYSMTIHGVGAAQSVASNRYPSGSAFNRRVEIRIN